MIIIQSAKHAFIKQLYMIFIADNQHSKAQSTSAIHKSYNPKDRLA